MKTKATGMAFERELVSTVVDLGRELGMTHSDVARSAWPEIDSSVVRWRQIRNVSGTGRPQNLTLDDAFRLAGAVGQTLPSLCFMVQQKLNLGLSPQKGDQKKGRLSLPFSVHGLPFVKSLCYFLQVPGQYFLGCGHSFHAIMISRPVAANHRLRVHHFGHGPQRQGHISQLSNQFRSIHQAPHAGLFASIF